MSVWALLFAAAAAWGGPLEASKVPALTHAQLALPLEGPASITAIQALDTLSMVPLLGPALPEELRRPLDSGDALAFYRAAEKLEYTAPPSDERQAALLEEGAAKARAEDEFYEKLAAVQPKDRVDALGRLAGRSPPSTVQGRRDALIQAGYERLRGPGRSFVDTRHADSSRVNQAFLNTLKTYRNRAAK